MELHCLVALWRTIRRELFGLTNSYAHPLLCRSQSDTVDNNLRLVEDLQRESIDPDASWFLAESSPKVHSRLEGRSSGRTWARSSSLRLTVSRRSTPASTSRTTRNSSELSRSSSPLSVFSIQPRQAALGFQSASEETARQARNLKVEFEKEATESQAGHCHY